MFDFYKFFGFQKLPCIKKLEILVTKLGITTVIRQLDGYLVLGEVSGFSRMNLIVLDNWLGEALIDDVFEL